VSLRVLAALVLALVLSSAPTAEAHRPPAPIAATTDVAAPAPAPAGVPEPGPPPVLRDASSPPVSPWLLGAALAGAIGLRALRCSRNARRWALLLLFVSFTAEIGVHAVHHLGDPRGAAGCYPLSLGQQLSAAAPGAPDVAAPGQSTAIVPALPPEPAACTSHAPDRGRAPPARVA
jgi:hypothetical protein